MSLLLIFLRRLLLLIFFLFFFDLWLRIIQRYEVIANGRILFFNHVIVFAELLVSLLDVYLHILLILDGLEVLITRNSNVVAVSIFVKDLEWLFLVVLNEFLQILKG